MLKKALAGAGILIGIFLVVDHYTGSGTVISRSASGASNVVKSLQGRT